MKYWLQRQAPSGNWVDRVGYDDLLAAISHFRWCNTQYPEQHRVIERTDVELNLFMIPTKDDLSHELAVEGFADTDDAAAWLMDNFEIRRK